MVSAMKTALHKLIALITAVCLCTSMVPATAFGANSNYTDGSSASGLQTFQPGAEIDGQKTATATSDVSFFLRDENFTFKDVTESRNFTNPQQAIDLTASGATGQNAGPLTATFAGTEGTYEYLWTVVEVDYDEDGNEVEKPHATTATFTGPSNDPNAGGTFGTIDEEGNRVGDFVKGTVTTNATFTHSITAADGLEQDKTYRYTLYIATDSPTRMEARAQMLVTIYEGYKLMSLYVEGNGSLPPSVRGSLFTQGLPAPIMPSLSSDTVANTDPVYNKLTQAAAPSQAITDPLKLVLTDLEDKPADKDAYIGELKVNLPLTNENFADLKEGDTVSVFHYDPATGEVKERVANVVRQKDANGNDVADSEGNPVLVAQLGITGGSTALGTFAVGYKVEAGTFNVQSSAGEGGTISPAGSNSYPVPSTEVAEGDPAWPSFILYPLDGYRIKGVALTRNGTTVATAEGSLVGNTFTFSPELYTINRGENWTIEAQFEKPTGLEEKYSVTGTLQGVGNPGTMTFASAAPNLNPVEVAMGQTRPDTGEELILMPSSAGVNVTFNPGPGHRLKSFTINGIPYSVNGSSYYISVLDQNMDLVAEYEAGLPPTAEMRRVDFEVDGGENGHGTIALDDGSFGTSGSREVNFGGSTTLTLKPDEQYMVSKVMAYNLDDNGNPITPGTALTSVQDQTNQEVYNLPVNNVLQNMKIVVTFTMSSATVTVTNLKAAEAPNAVDPSGPVKLELGVLKTITITPPANYTVGAITYDGAEVPKQTYLNSHDNGAYYTINLVRADHRDPSYGNAWYVDKATGTLTIDFDPVTPPAPSYVNINTHVADPGGGSITPSQKVLPGQDVDLFFFPDDGKTIGTVTVDGTDVTTAVDQNAGKLTLQNVVQSHDVIVTFIDGDSPLAGKKRYTIHPSSGIGGSVSPQEPVLVYEGQTQKFSFIPSTGYELSTIRVDGNPIDIKTDPSYDKDLLTYTLEPTGDKTDINLVGTFSPTDISGDEKPTYTVDISGGPNGTVSPSGLITVARGSVQAITLIPDDGYHVSKIWQGKKNEDGTEGDLQNMVGGLTNGVYTLWDVQADMVIKVEFAEGKDDSQPSTDEDNLIRLGLKNVAIGAGVTVTPAVEGSVFYKEAGTNHANVAADFTIQVAAGYKLGTILLNDVEVKATEVEPGVYHLTIPKESITQDMYLSVSASSETPSTETVDMKSITLEVTGNGTVSPSESPFGSTDNVVRVATGTSQTFSFIPEPGNTLSTVKVNNKVVSAEKMEITQDGQTVVSYYYTFPAVNQDTRLEVTFVEDPNALPPIKPYTVSVTHVSGDNNQVNGFYSIGTGSSAAKVLPGMSLGITFQPAPGYETHVYKGSGKDDCTAANEVTSELTSGTLIVGPVDSDLQYVVWFQPIGQAVVYHTVTAMEAENGSIQPSGRSTVVDGAEKTFTLVGDTDGTDTYVPDKVYITRGGGERTEVWASGTGTDVLIDTTKQTITIQNIKEDVVIEAEFKPGTPATTFVPIKLVAGTGGSFGEADYQAAAGSTTQVTIMPNAGYKLKTLTNTVGTGAAQDVTADVKDGTYSFTVTSDPLGHVIEATFEKDEAPGPSKDFYNVFINPGAHGTTSPTGMVSVPAGGSAYFSIIPDEGYKVRQIVLTSDSNPSGTVKEGHKFSYFLAGVKEDMNIIVEFEPLANGETLTYPTFYTIKADTSPNGAVSPAGEVQVAEGEMAAFYFAPDKGYKLSYLVVDGEDLPPSALNAAGQYCFSNVKADHTIQGVFCSEDETAAEFATVNAATAGGGTVTPTGAKLVRKGTNASFTVAAMFGYKLDDIQLTYGETGTPESIFPDAAGGGKDTGNLSNAKVEWANGKLTLKNVQEDIGLNAIFSKKDTTGEEPVEYSTIKMTVGPNGSTSLAQGPNVIEALPVDGSMNVSVIPDEGYAVDYVKITPASGPVRNLTGDQAKAVWTNGYFTLSATDVNYECSVEVAFRKQTAQEEQDIQDGTLKPAEYRTIVATKTGRGTIIPSGTVKVSVTASIMFSMIPNEGYELSGLTVNGKDELGSLGEKRSYTFPAGKDDGTIEAAFSQTPGPDQGISYLLQARTSGTGGAGGSVSVAEQKILAGGNGIVYFLPNADSKLVKVGVKVGTGEEVFYNQETLSYQVNGITADTVVTGYFELGESPIKPVVKDMNITVAPSGGGTVSPSGTPAAKVPAGSMQIINLFPDAGYEVNFIVVNGKANYIDASLRSYSVLADRNEDATNVEVYYKKVEGEPTDVTVTTKVSATVNGSVSGAGGAQVWPATQTVPAGTPVTFYVKPDEGKTIYAVYVTKDGKKHYIAFRGVTGAGSEKIPSDQLNWSNLGRDSQTSGVAGEERAAAAAGLYAGGAVAAPAMYRGGAGLTTAAAIPDSIDYGENGPVTTSPDGNYYEMYEITLPPELLEQLMDPDTGEINIDVEMRDIDKNDVPFDFITTTIYEVNIDAGTGGMAEPFGKGIMAWGASQNIRVTTFGGYYLESITRTYTYETGDPVTEDITHLYKGNASLGNLMVTFGDGSGYDPDNPGSGREPLSMDIKVSFKRQGEASFVHLGMGSVTGPTGPGGAMVDIKDKIKVEPYTIDPITGMLLGPDGKLANFDRDLTGNGTPTTFTFEPDPSLKGPNGRPLIVDTVYYNGQPVHVEPGTNTASVQLTASGKFDVTYREADEGEVPPEVKTYTATGTVGSGQGTVTSVHVVKEGQTAQIGYKPDEGWMLDQEASYDEYADDDGVVRKHPLEAAGLANDEGVYNIFNMDRDHNVVLVFVEAVEVTLKWDNEGGYVMPNTQLGGSLVWAKGKPLPVVVAPYVQFDVESLTVAAAGNEDNVTGSLAQTEAARQSLHNKMAEEGLSYRVQNFTAGAGVQGATAAAGEVQEQAVQPLVQAERAENGTFYGAAPKASTNEAKPTAHFNYAYSYTAPIMASTDIRATWTREAEPPVQTHRVTASAIADSSGNPHGYVDPTEEDVPHGGSCTFNFFPDEGYQVVLLEIDGRVIPYSSTSYTVTNVTGPMNIRVGFSVESPKGGNDVVDRMLRTLKALAQTGDLTAPLVGGLVLIAVIGFTGAAISSRRSRRKQHQA